MSQVATKPRTPRKPILAEPVRATELRRTVADLMKSLGDIPASRIRLDVSPGQATEADVLRILDAENRVCEIIDGTLVEKAMEQEEGWVTIELIWILGSFLKQHNLGISNGPDSTLRLTSGLLRVPDISYISWDHLPGRKRPVGPVPTLGLDLAIEVLSRSNSKKEMARKVREYFESVVRQVWLIDPRKRTARVFTSRTQSTLLTESDTLTGGEILPGFRVDLRDLLKAAFRGPDE